MKNNPSENTEISTHTVPVNTSEKKQKSSSGIWTVGILFIVIFAGILTAFFLISQSIEKDAGNINIAGRQRMLSQRLAKSMESVEIDLLRNQAPEVIKEHQKEVNLSYSLFDSTLAAFRDGGKVKTPTGEDRSVEPITDQTLRPYAVSYTHLTLPTIA